MHTGMLGSAGESFANSVDLKYEGAAGSNLRPEHVEACTGVLRVVEHVEADAKVEFPDCRELLGGREVADRRRTDILEEHGVMDVQRVDGDCLAGRKGMDDA